MDVWEKLLRWIADHKDALGWLFGTGVATALLTGLYKLVRWLIEARRRRQLRPRHGPFVVLPPGSDLLPVLLPDPTDSPLSDYRIPYLERQPGRSVRREMEDLLREKGALLVVGKSGIGKTREAAHLAQMLNSEGWTVLYLPPDAYLEPPASLPSGCPARKILLFLDDLNRRCYAARREVSPRAEESLAMPLTEPFQRRLQKTLEVFETFCSKGELLILATARNEQTPEYEGEPAEWDKLEWDRYPDLWKRFALYELPEFSPEAGAALLLERGQAAGVRVENPEALARRNDGTPRNLVENLRMAANPERGLPALTPETFRDTLRGTWAERYRRAVAQYPEARYLYWAAVLLRRYGFPLAAYTVLPLARALMNAYVAQDSSCAAGPAGFPTRQIASSVWDTLYKQIRQVLTGWVQYLRLPRALRYLERHEAIYSPRDGQLEAAGSPEVEEEEVVQALIRLGFRHRLAEALDNLAGMLIWPDPAHSAVYHPDAVRILRSVTAWRPQEPGAWYRLGVALDAAGQKEKAIKAFQKAVALDPKFAYPWHGLGNVYSGLGRYEEAIEAYQRAIVLDPQFAYPWNCLGVVHALREEWEQALEAFRRAVELAPEQGGFHASLAGALQTLGREEEARVELERARPLMERESEYNRACFAAICGETEEALRLLEIALGKWPGLRLWARQDPDLRSLHSDPRFWQIVAQD